MLSVRWAERGIEKKSHSLDCQSLSQRNPQSSSIKQVQLIIQRRVYATERHEGGLIFHVMLKLYIAKDGKRDLYKLSHRAPLTSSVSQCTKWSEAKVLASHCLFLFQTKWYSKQREKQQMLEFPSVSHAHSSNGETWNVIEEGQFE